MQGAVRVRAILVAQGNVFDIRQHRSLRSAVSRMTHKGELVEVLPRLYVPAEHRSDPSTLLRALTLWSPKAVIVGATAWQLHLGETPQAPFTIARASGQALPRWVRRIRRAIPSDSIVERHGIRCASPAYLAVEGAAHDEGEMLFTVLRTGRAKVDDLVPTLAAFRRSPGNRTRARITRQCLLKPWSFAELKLQQLLLANGIDDWVANHPFVVDAVTVVADLYFPAAGVVVEFDSWEFHSSREAFEADRHKQNLLARCGLRVARITWQMLTADPEGLIRTLRGVLLADAA